MNEMLKRQFDRYQRIAIGCGVVGGLLCITGAIFSARNFFVSYLWAWLFWLGLGLGSMCLAMIHSLTGGRWGDVTRRVQEAAAMTLPVMAFLFIPLLFGLHELYSWARPEEVASNPVLQKRLPYMSFWPFVGRAIFAFVTWTVMATFFRRWSLGQDATADLTPTRRLRALSGPGLILYVLTTTLVCVDWIMSLETSWFSTMFPIIICISQLLTALTFSILALACLRKSEPIAAVVSAKHLHQLGNLLLAFVMFWTYISFGQLLIIYSGDIPREISWYLHRIAGNWKWVVGFIALFHFFIPFYLLLFRPLKQKFASLATLAGIVFFMRMVDVFWYVKPAFAPDGISVHWMDLAAPLGLGGIWLAVFIAGLKGCELMPRNDPRIVIKEVVHAR